MDRRKILAFIKAYALGLLLIFSPLVISHELGHYFAGLAFGLRAQTFSVFFGPAIWSFTDSHGTVWQLGCLPFGGYNYFTPDAFRQLHTWQALVVMAAGVTVNFAEWVLFRWLYPWFRRRQQIFLATVCYNIYLNAGILAGLNSLPLGDLDGGHIVQLLLATFMTPATSRWIVVGLTELAGISLMIWGMFNCYKSIRLWHANRHHP